MESAGVSVGTAGVIAPNVVLLDILFLTVLVRLRLDVLEVPETMPLPEIETMVNAAICSRD
jgi:hypothetical protein